MLSRPVLASPGRRQAGSGLWRACAWCLLCWAVAGTALSLWVFHAWAQPLPSAIELQGPVGADANLDFWVGGLAMALPLFALSVTAAVTGSVYLSGIRPARRVRVSWMLAMIVMAAAELVFIAIFMNLLDVPGIRLGQPNPALLAVTALFAADGAAMIAIITSAARQATAI